MPDLVSPLNWTAEAWTALATWGALGVALAAVVFARGQVLEARRTREEEAQPFVVVDFEPSAVWSGLMDLVITNTGKTVAKDVRVTFEPPLRSAYFSNQPDDPYDINETKIIKEGIPSLPPGKRFAILFDRMPDRYESELPRVYRATVTFSSSRRVEEPLEYLLDLGTYFGYRQVEVLGLHDVAKALTAIERALRQPRR